MNNKVLLLADPNSIHTKKWLEGWSYLGYIPFIGGLSKYNFDNKLIFQANINVGGGNAKEYLKNTLKLKEILLKENPDIINAHYMTSYGLIASLIKRKQDIIVLFLMGDDVMVNLDKSIIHRMVAKFILYRSDVLVSSSRAMTDKILGLYPETKNKILTQQYGIDIEKMNQYYTDKKTLSIITNRGWVRNSNYEILLEVFDKITRSKALIGYSDTEYAHGLVKKFSELKDDIYPSLSYSENMYMVGKSKIFISLTSSDGLSLSLLEAMYLGAIPIVSDIEPNREIIIDGENGFLIPINGDVLLEKILYVLSLSEEELVKIRYKNKELIITYFNLKSNFETLQNFIETHTSILGVS